MTIRREMESWEPAVNLKNKRGGYVPAIDAGKGNGRHDFGKALDEANAKGWMVVDMKRDWKRIFPFESESTDFRAMELMK